MKASGTALILRSSFVFLPVFGFGLSLSKKRKSPQVLGREEAFLTLFKWVVLLSLVAETQQLAAAGASRAPPTPPSNRQDARSTAGHWIWQTTVNPNDPAGGEGTVKSLPPLSPPP